MNRPSHQQQTRLAGWRGRLATPRTRRVGLWLLFLLVVVGAYEARVSGHMVDFEVDYRAGHRLLQGEDLYQAEDGHYMYRYLPGAAVLEMPFALLSPKPARAVFYAVTVACLLGVLALSYRLLPDTAPRRPVLIWLTFLVLGKFFVREIFLGQINLIITVLLLMMVWQLDAARPQRWSRREVTAGVLWGVATTLKPYGLVFLPHLLVTRRWRAVLTGVGASALAAAYLVPSYGIRGTIDQHRAWAASLAESTPHLFTNIDNVSLINFFVRLTGDTDHAVVPLLLTVLVLATLIAIVVYMGKDQPRAVVLEGALLLTLIPLLAPLGWDYMLLMSVLAIMLLLQQRARFSRFWRAVLVVNLVVIAVTLTELIGHTLHELYENWSLATVNFLVVVAYLAALRFKRIC